MDKKVPSLDVLQHPDQPIGVDLYEVERFKENPIVRFLLDWATLKGMSLNELAIMPFDDADRVQFAQLIGYSVSGFGELSYVSDEAFTRATGLPVTPND